MKKIVISTGAGMSAESGIKTFRDADGLWENYPVMEVASHTGFLKNPELIHTFYNGLRKKLVEAKPNAAHYALAELEKDFDVQIITQNVDDLHERAGSSKVLHLHGELMKMCSSIDPDDERYHVQLTPENPTVVPGTKAGDGSLLRPFIVFFGEAVPMIEPAAREAMDADIFIIIGTSLNVYPAAGLVRYVKAGVPVYLIDPKPVTASVSGVKHIQKGASEGMKELMSILCPSK